MRGRCPDELFCAAVRLCLKILRLGYTLLKYFNNSNIPSLSLTTMNWRMIDEWNGGSTSESA